jgi:holo-[acyl-carrier protein] synthase
MIVGVGTDLVAVERIAGILDRHGERAIRRIFSESETAYCRGRGSPAASFAVRFAAKEAFYKALGTGVGEGGRWTDVEVVRAPTGPPHIRLLGVAAFRAAERGVRHVHLTLSHTDDFALAFVVLES